MSVIARWTIGNTWTAPAFEGDDKWAGTIQGPRLDGVTVEVVPAEQLAGAVAALREITQMSGDDSDELLNRVHDVARRALAAAGGQ